MRLLSTFRETFVRAALCTRATLVSFPYHVRHFCGAHTPIFYSRTPRLPPLNTPRPSPYISFFSPLSRLDDRASSRLGLSFVCRNFRAPFRSSSLFFGYPRVPRDTAKRSRDDTALLHARVHFVDKSTRVVCRQKLENRRAPIGKKSPRSVSPARRHRREFSSFDQGVTRIYPFFPRKKKPVSLAVSDSNVHFPSPFIRFFPPMDARARTRNVSRT